MSFYQKIRINIPAEKKPWIITVIAVLTAFFVMILNGAAVYEKFWPSTVEAKTKRAMKLIPKLEALEANGEKCIQGDCLNGCGIKVYEDGGVYQGEFVNGMKYGFGCYVYRNHEFAYWYIGEFKRDIKRGHGVFHFRNGDWYEGDFLNDKRHGIGTQYLKSKNESLDGQWINNKFVETKKQVSI